MLENLSLERVAIHEVVPASDLQNDAAVETTQLLALNDAAKRLICDRLVSCIGSNSHCVDVEVEDHTEGSAFQKCASLLDADSTAYTTLSASLARSLSRAQISGSIKAGVGVFLQGTGWLDGSEVRWICVMKADPDRGLVKKVTGTRIELQYVSDLIMGAQQRLLKVAFIVEELRNGDSGAAQELREPSDFGLKVYDHLMSNTGKGTAAQYFYSAFLGCRLADNSAKQTRDFYEKTRKFIDSVSTDASERIEIRGHLVSYLKSQKSVISTSDFAESYLPTEKQTAYKEMMKKAGISDTGISKDNALVKTRLRKQTLRFSSKVFLYASPEQIRDSIKIEKSIKKGGSKWTRLLIKGELENQP